MDNHTNILSVCTGIGGLDLGLRLAIPCARTVCYVEGEAYACSLLAEKMRTGEMDEAPVWTDMRTFDGEPWRGVVDCIAGGIPCQPWSTAGKHAGADDDRDLWSSFARIVGEIEPVYAFIENVPGIVQPSMGLRRIRRDLERMGYEVAAGLFTAAEVGASHKRERLFVLAYRQGERVQGLRASGEQECNPSPQETLPRRNGLPIFPPGPADADAWREVLEVAPHLAPAVESGVRSLADGFSAGLGEHRTDQLRAYGNAVVPLAAAYAFVSLYACLQK